MKAQRNALEKRIIAALGTRLERAPWATCRRVGAFFGLAFYYGARNRRAIAHRNLRLVFPDWSDAQIELTARRSSQNFGMSFCEFLHLRTASPQSIRDYADIEGLGQIEAARALGHGVVLPTAHFGAWEVMAARVTQEFPLTVIVRLTSNAALREHILRVREAIGVGMILKTESAREPLKTLRANGALGVFPDQHAGASGVLMPMFGHPTRIFTSTARLALAANAPLIPAFAVRRKPWISDGRVLIKVSPGLSLHDHEYSKQFATRDENVLEGTRFIVRATEKIVREYPEQWLWMHRRWREEDARDAQLESQNEDENREMADLDDIA